MQCRYGESVCRPYIGSPFPVKVYGAGYLCSFLYENTVDFSIFCDKPGIVGDRIHSVVYTCEESEKSRFFDIGSGIVDSERIIVTLVQIRVTSAYFQRIGVIYDIL